MKAGARLSLYQGKGHAGVMTHKPAIREIVAFLRTDQPPAHLLAPQQLPK